MNTYFDNAATTFPKPVEVRKAVATCLEEFSANPGRGSHRLAREAERIVEECRQELARLYHTPNPHHVIFTLNATDAINMAINGVVKPKDKVLTTVYEHNAVLRVLFELEKQGIIDVQIVCPSGDNYTPQDFLPHLDDRVRLVCLNHASNVTGMILPVEEIAKVIRQRSNALILVDVSQTAGILSLDGRLFDLIGGTGHKHLYGPMGIGFLIVGEALDLKPWRVGGTGYRSEDVFQPREMPYLLEAGTPNLPGIAGLLAGIRWLSHQKSPLEHDKQLVTLFLKEMEATRYTIFGSPNNLGVVSLTHSLIDPVDLATILDSEYDIASRAGLHCAPLVHKKLGTFPNGTLRLSFSLWHTDEDIYHLTEVLCTVDQTLA
jgi:cysteine desulfurase family protein